MRSEPRDPVLTEQLDYYCARAGDYDEWFYRKGRYDRGQGATKQWRAELGEIEQSLARSAPFGDCLELACGTGLWTRHLVTQAGSLCALDGSQEMLSRCRERLPKADLEFVQADLFGFWLSHIPPDYFAPFWHKVRAALRPEGRVFFVDSKHIKSSTASDHNLPPAGELSLIRKLNDGREFRIYKVFHQVHDLQARLHALGFALQIKQSSQYFIYGEGSPIKLLLQIINRPVGSSPLPPRPKIPRA